MSVLKMPCRSPLPSAAETVNNLGWFEVTEIRGRLNGSQVEAWQVTVKVGFTVE
jgi:dodecin